MDYLEKYLALYMELEKFRCSTGNNRGSIVFELAIMSKEMKFKPIMTVDRAEVMKIASSLQPLSVTGKA